MTVTTIAIPALGHQGLAAPSSLRRAFTTLWSAMEARGRRRAALALEQRAEQYAGSSPGYAQELLNAAATLRQQ
jgi:hypothetical protein